MASVRWVLLVIEDETFKTESISYAINLAKRIDCSISVLMLTENPDSERYPLANESEIIKKILHMIKAEGVPVQGTSKHGDKASGLLKHLASYSSFEAIIWGGKEAIVSKHIPKKPAHWLGKIKATIRCPVISPTKKNSI